MTKLRNIAAKAEERITGRRFCTAHQGAAEIAGGMMRASRGSPRWICASCVAKGKYKVRPPSDEEMMANVISSEIANPRAYQPLNRGEWKPPKILTRDGSEDYKNWPSKGGD